MLTIPASDLAKALSAAASIVETKNILPILAMVRIEADGDSITITTTNLDIEYRQVIACEVKTPFATCVDAKKLAAMASAAKGNITLSLDKSILTVKSGRSRWAVPALPSDDFPVMPIDKLSPPMKIDGKTFASHLRRTVWAASTESTRFYLVGVFLNNENGVARMAATDSHRLASLTTSVKWPKGAPDVIVPTRLASVIASDCEGPVSVSWDASKMQVVAGAVTITGKMIEGTYPDYRRVIPSDPFDNPIAIDAAEMLDAVRGARIASDAKLRTLRMTRKDGSLFLKIEGTSGAEGESEVTADCAEGYESAINADYLVDILSNAYVETFAIEQASPSSPYVFRPVSQAPDSTFIGVVMPLRI